MLSSLLSHGHDIRPLPRTPSLLHCIPRAVGYEQRKAEIYSWDGMKRGSEPFLVLQHTTFGEGRLDFDGTAYRLTPGQTMLVTVPHAHRYWLERGGHWEYFWALLHGREALRLARDLIAQRGPVLEIGPAVDRLAGAVLTLLTQTLTPGQASAQAYEMMAALHDGALPPTAPGPLPTAFARVLSHVDAHLSEALTVDRLARVAGQSRAHFVRGFRAALGQPPSDYIQSRRIERVERLLLASEMTVDQIARTTGFSDGNYLAKVFRRHRGLTPLAFRATRHEAG